MKTILYLTVPLNREGDPIVSKEKYEEMCKEIQTSVGDEYIVVASPFHLDVVRN